MEGNVCLIRRTILIRGMSQDHSGLPCIRSASTLASIPLVHLRLSERKIEWRERSAGYESTPGPLDRDAHVPCRYRTVNHPSSGQNFIMSALAFVDIRFSTSSVASRLACVFVRAWSQSFIRRHSSYPMMNAEKQQGISLT